MADQLFTKWLDESLGIPAHRYVIVYRRNEKDPWQTYDEALTIEEARAACENLVRYSDDGESHAYELSPLIVWSEYKEMQSI